METQVCGQCGEPMWTADDGTSYHRSSGPYDTTRELDVDHIAVAR